MIWRKRSEAGMTLVELMLAMGVLATVMAIMSSSVASIAKSGASAGVRTVAANLAQSIFEEMRGTSPEDAFAYEVPFAEDEEGHIIVPGLGTVELTLTAVLGDGSLFVIGGPDPPSATNIPDPMEVLLEMTVTGRAPVRFRSSMVVSSF